MAGKLMLDARHVTASAAGSIARVAAQISRALAWEATPAHAASFLQSIDTALDALRAAEAELIEARACVRIAAETASKRLDRRPKERKER